MPKTIKPQNIDLGKAAKKRVNSTGIKDFAMNLFI
jgi:hypothetical protein